MKNATLTVQARRSRCRAGAGRPTLSSPFQMMHRSARRQANSAAIFPVADRTRGCSLLSEMMQARALRAADDPHQTDFADYLFWRVVELREAGR